MSMKEFIKISAPKAILGQEVEAAEQLSKLKERKSALTKSATKQVTKGWGEAIAKKFLTMSETQIGNAIERLSEEETEALYKYYNKGA